MNLINRIREQARQDCQRIVLPEGFEERTIMAADAIIREKLCYVYLVADPEDLEKKVNKYGLKNIEKATVINPKDHPRPQLKRGPACTDPLLFVTTVGNISHQSSIVNTQ